MITTRPQGFLLGLAALVVLLVAAYALQSGSRSVLPAALQTAVQHRREPDATAKGMAGMLPPGALLTIESPDFAGLLKSWQGSPESAAWLTSANYSVFSNSRLFSRLADAQTEFVSAAGLAGAGTTFLNSVAGRESIFGWYDVGGLEFLYITRMTPARAAQVSLLRQRAGFKRRQMGASVFYVRTKAGTGISPDRTVAFATSGDLLLLSTREDLMAGALDLVAGGTGPSVASEPWFNEVSEVTTAAVAEHGTPDLHMVLNLDRIVPISYFRSYWAQRNVTEFKQYRSAVSDLYREPTRFREERTILLKAVPADSSADPDLAPLAALPPPDTGLYRVTANPDDAAVTAALNDKILGREDVPKPAMVEPAEVDLTPPSAGNTDDLETRIDTPAPVSGAASTEALRRLFRAAGVDALMTVDSASAVSSAESLWLPIHSAVVLRTARPIEPTAMLPALQAALRGSLTASTLGIEFKPVGSGGQGMYMLDGPRRLYLALAGSLCLLSDDQAMLSALLTRAGFAQQPAPQPAVYLAAFNHATQRAPYARLTSRIEPTGRPTSPNAPDAPSFFSANIRSLSDSFTALQSERMVTRHTAGGLHQTVVYEWGTP